ncbi:MAG: PEGA domain-containing protein, partial [Myxococcaceae bacterium]
MKFAFLAALLLISVPAFADNTADEADLAFTLGNDAFTKGNFNEALRNYFVSYRLVPNKNVLFNIARCYEALEKFDEAYRYFNDLLQTDLPAEDRADVQKSLARIRPRVALVKVTSEPTGADVFVNREDLGSRGRTPLSLALPPGKQLLLVKKEGFHPAEQSVVLAKGKETAQAFTLSLIVGKVALSGTAGAVVRDRPDGPVLATVPGELSLPPGRHLLIVSAERHATQQFLIEVAAEKTSTLDAQLAAETAPTGKLIVTANHQDALIRVDGRDSGFTPTVLTLTEGDHTVELTYGDLRPQVEKVHIARDSESKLTVELRYAPPPVQAASKRLLSVDEAPASTTVISAEELRAFGYTTVADALQAVRGVYLSYDRQYQYLGVRGFSPPGDLNTRVLVLWDGHAMNDVWAGQGYAGRDLTADLSEIERIEVVRGPGSALYGSGAFFAVINVVPRDRLEAHRNVELSGMAGSLSLADGHVAVSAGAPGGNGFIASASGLYAYGAETTDLGAGVG